MCTSFSKQKIIYKIKGSLIENIYSVPAFPYEEDGPGAKAMEIYSILFLSAA